MKIDITIQQTVEIPDEHLLDLAAKVREKWNLGESAPVHAEDLLIEAHGRALITLPDRWRLMEYEDQSYMDSELVPEKKCRKKLKRK